MAFRRHGRFPHLSVFFKPLFIFRFSIFFSCSLYLSIYIFFEQGEEKEVPTRVYGYIFRG